MLRTLKATITATCGAAGLLVCGTADAQWGYAPGPTYFHAPSVGSSFSFGYSTGSRYSLYGPSYTQAFGYQTAYPAYGHAPVLAPTYPVTAAPRGRLEYDVYTPSGRQEVNYRFRRDGSVRVDVDD